MHEGMWYFLVLIGIFYAIGIGGLWYSLHLIKRSQQPAGWPLAVGTIESCDLDSHIDYDDDGEVTFYQVKVNYSYTVGGRELMNDVLVFGYCATNSQKVHQEIFDKLAAAHTVQVRYDPSDPQTSVLSFGVHRSIWLSLAFAILWLLLVSGFTIIWWAIFFVHRPKWLFLAFGISFLLFVIGIAIHSWIVPQNDHVLLENLVTH